MSLDIGWAQLGSSHLVIRTWGLPYSGGHMMAMAGVILNVSSIMCLLAGTPGGAVSQSPTRVLFRWHWLPHCITARLQKQASQGDR